MHPTPHRGWQLRQMEIPGQPVLLEPLAQIAERASQGALQLLQLADLAPGGLPALGRGLTESAQLGRAVVEETPRSDTRQIGQCRRDRRTEHAGGGFRIGVGRRARLRDDRVGDPETPAFGSRQRA